MGPKKRFDDENVGQNEKEYFFFFITDKQNFSKAFHVIILFTIIPARLFVEAQVYNS